MNRAAEISAQLKRCRSHWLPKVFPQGVIRRGVFFIGDAVGSAGRSLPIQLNGKRQHISDFAGGFRGDDLDLFAAGKGLNLPDAMREAARFLGLEDRQPTHQPAPPPEPVIEDRKSLSDFGRQLWWACQDITLNDTAGQYLANRGCELPIRGGDVRWHPNLKHLSGYHGPALVALITDALDNEPLSLHRTWIQPDGRKADLNPSRLLLAGHTKRNGVIRVWPDDWVTYGLGIAEGIESALTLARAFTPVWSTIDAGNMARFPVLPVIEALTVAVDNEDTGRKAADAVARRWYAAGREVRLIQPPKPGQDINDWARENG